MAQGDGTNLCLWCCLTSLILGLVLIVSLASAYSDFDPVEVTVEEASLGRLALAARPAGGNATTPASLAYNLSLAVALRNPNWAIRVWRTAPLEAELRLAGRPFAVVHLAGAEERELIGPKRSAVYRVVAAAASAPVALGSEEEADLARESSAGLFRREIVVAGQVHIVSDFTYTRDVTPCQI